MMDKDCGNVALVIKVSLLPTPWSPTLTYHKWCESASRLTSRVHAKHFRRIGPCAILGTRRRRGRRL